MTGSFVGVIVSLGPCCPALTVVSCFSAAT
jgi:hypothetical protein